MQGKSRGALAWTLAKHRRQGELSRLTPFIAVLPANFSERPARWPRQLLREHSRGSAFADYVAEEEVLVRKEFAALNQQRRHEGGSPHWEDFQWAYDAVATRAMAADHGGSSRILFPLADMCNHGDVANVRMRWKSSETGGGSRTAGNILLMTAVRPIRAGEELFNSYGERGWISTWDSAQLWGFVSPAMRASRKTVRLPVTQASLLAAGVDVSGTNVEQQLPRNFTISDALQEDGGLLDFVRDALRNHASDHGRKEDAHSWPEEAKAMKVCSTLVEGALLAYADELRQDEEILAAIRDRMGEEGVLSSNNSRVLLLVELRRDEKLVLQWWRRLLQNAEHHAQNSHGRLFPGYLRAVGRLWEGEEL